MKTLQEVYDIIDYINEEAHQFAWDKWVLADELMESDDDNDLEEAENLREEASQEQAGYFRDRYYDLEEDDITAITHYLKEDQEFKETFAMYFGEEQFEEDFDNE